jgi:hypothetical protein
MGAGRRLATTLTDSNKMFLLCAFRDDKKLEAVTLCRDCGYDKRVELDANYVSDWRFSTDLSYWCEPWAPLSSGREVTDSPSTYFLGPRPLHADAKVSCESRQGFCRLSGANRRNEKGQPQKWRPGQFAGGFQI